jgi:hypothetical protein
VSFDLQSMALWILSLGFGVLGWFARELYQAIQSLKKDLNTLEVKIGTDYVRYDRLRDALTPIERKLDVIHETLSKKVDK